jgi:hypothetical protein
MHSDDLFDVWGDALAIEEDEQENGDGVPRAVTDATGTDEVFHRPLPDPFPDPFVDDLGIEYWIWNGSRLVPAWPDEVERIRAGEDRRKEQARQQMVHPTNLRQERLSSRLAVFGGHVWRRCAHWLGIPPALFPRELPRHQGRPQQPDA